MSLFKPKAYDYKTHDWDEIDRILEENWKALHEHDKKLGKEGKLVGRFIKEGVADGNAIYQIIKENKRTVRIRRIPFVCPDEYQVRYWGNEATIDKAYAIKSIRGREAISKIFGRK